MRWFSNVFCNGTPHQKKGGLKFIRVFYSHSRPVITWLLFMLKRKQRRRITFLILGSFRIACSVIYRESTHQSVIGYSCDVVWRRTLLNKNSHGPDLAQHVEWTTVVPELRYKTRIKQNKVSVLKYCRSSTIYRNDATKKAFESVHRRILAYATVRYLAGNHSCNAMQHDIRVRAFSQPTLCWFILLRTPWNLFFTHSWRLVRFVLCVLSVFCRAFLSLPCSSPGPQISLTILSPYLWRSPLVVNFNFIYLKSNEVPLFFCT